MASGANDSYNSLNNNYLLVKGSLLMQGTFPTQLYPMEGVVRLAEMSKYGFHNSMASLELMTRIIVSILSPCIGSLLSKELFQHHCYPVEGGRLVTTPPLHNYVYRDYRHCLTIIQVFHVLMAIIMLDRLLNDLSDMCIKINYNLFFIIIIIIYYY